MGHATDLTRMRMKRRHAQMKFLLENFDKPVLEADGFGEVKINEDGYSPTGISLSILNCNIENLSHGPTISPNQISTFMSHIQGYLPYKLRPSDRKCKPLWTKDTFSSNCDIGEESLELIDAMREWYLEMKKRIMNDITFRYYLDGKVQYGEILKRRFKNEYSEKVEQSVQANVAQDSQINLIIDEA